MKNSFKKYIQITNIACDLNTNYLWVKEIQVCSNKGPGSLQRGDNHKNVKMGWGHLNILFYTEPLGQF